MAHIVRFSKRRPPLKSPPASPYTADAISSPEARNCAGSHVKCRHCRSRQPKLSQHPPSSRPFPMLQEAVGALNTCVGRQTSTKIVWDRPCRLACGHCRVLQRRHSPLSCAPPRRCRMGWTPSGSSSRLHCAPEIERSSRVLPWTIQAPWSMPHHSWPAPPCTRLAP